MGYALPPRVVLVTEKRVSRAWAAGRHAHRDVHELIVVTEGCIHASAGGSLLEAAAGGSIVYPAGCAHEEHAVAGGGASLVCVWWRGPLGDPALGKAGPTVRADRAGHVEQAARWLLRVWNEGADDVSPTGGASSAAADILAALLWERDCPPRRADDPAIEAAKRLAVRQLGRPTSVADLAAAACLSTDHFAHAFRRATGRSPAAYVRALRIAEARRLLLTTQQPLKAIAAAVGYGGAAELSRAFKRHTGTTPSAVREAR